jgi:hypothetical protein
MKTHIWCSITFFLRECVTYEMILKNMVETHMPQLRIRRMHFACWATKAKDTYSEYLIFIACPRHNVTRTHLHVTFTCTTPVLFDAGLAKVHCPVIKTRCTDSSIICCMTISVINEEPTEHSWVFSATFVY